MNEKEVNFENLILAKMQVTEYGIQKEIERIEALAKKVGIDIDIRNAGSIALKKMAEEIMPTLKNAGADLNKKPVILRATINYINQQVIIARNTLKQYEGIIAPDKMTDAKEENQLALKNKSVGIRLLELLKRTLFGSKEIKEPITPEALYEADMCMCEYEHANKQIEQYGVRENIIDEIVETICPRGGLRVFAREVPEIIYEEIAPVLVNLGLGSLIPQLEQKITSAYLAAESDRLRDASAEEREMYIPDFERYKEQIIEQTIQSVSTEPQTINYVHVDEAENVDDGR